MQTPLKIGFQGGAASKALSGLIGQHVASLEKLYGRMTACQVTVQVPDKLNGPFSVHIHLALPGGMNVNVDHAPFSDDRFFDPQFAVNDAFRRAKRALKDRARKRRGDVKTLHGRIDRTLDRPES